MIRRVYIVVIASLDARQDFDVMIEVKAGKRLGRDGDVHLDWRLESLPRNKRVQSKTLSEWIWYYSVYSFICLSSLCLSLPFYVAKRQR